MTNRPSRTIPRTSVTPKVYTHLRKNLNVVVHVDDIMKETGLQRKQVLDSIYGLRSRHQMPIDDVMRGQTFIARGLPGEEPGKREEAEPAAPTPAQSEPTRPNRRLFEEIGATRDGTLIIQDQEGGLFRAVEL